MNHKAILILLALTLVIYVGTAAEPGLWDDVDSGHALAAREILESGDWAVLHINGIRWLEKAPLPYWLVATSYALLGQGEFATRLPLALAVAGLVAMVYLFGRDFFGARAGFYAGLVMATSLGTFLFTRTFIPEALYALEFTAAFYLFLSAWTGRLSPRLGYWGCAVAVALAVLTRGLIGIIFPAAAIFLFLVATGSWRRWRELPIVSSVLVFLAVAAPWHVIVARRAPGFLWVYFVREHFLRALGEGSRLDFTSVPLGFWWLAHLAWFFPWSVFAAFALREALRVVRQPREWAQLDAPAQARLLLVLWAGFILLFFSVAQRSEYYSFGAWPAIALLIGASLARAEEENHRWLGRLQGALAVFGVVLAGGLIALLLVPPDGPPPQDLTGLLLLKGEYATRASLARFLQIVRAFEGLRAPALVAAVSLLAGLGGAWLLRRRGRAAAAGVAMAAGMAGFFFAANLGLGVFEPYLSSRALARGILRYLRPEDRVVIYGQFYGGSSIGFYTHRRTWILNGRFYGLEFGSYYPDAPKVFLTDSEFPAVWRGPGRVFLFVPQGQRSAAAARLPADATWLLADSAGKAVYVNQPLRPGQPPLGRLRVPAGGAGAGRGATLPERKLHMR